MALCWINANHCGNVREACFSRAMLMADVLLGRSCLDVSCGKLVLQGRAWGSKPCRNAALPQPILQRGRPQLCQRDSFSNKVPQPVAQGDPALIMNCNDSPANLLSNMANHSAHCYVFSSELEATQIERAIPIVCRRFDPCSCTFMTHAQNPHQSEIDPDHTPSQPTQ